MLPALYPFGSRERWIEALPAYFDEESRVIAAALLEKSLIPVVAGPEIALFLGISPRLITHMVRSPERYYRSFTILKRDGRERTIVAPRVFLKTVQRYVLDCILSQLAVHEAASGFRRGLNCGYGAGKHVGHGYLWNIDLADFFPSIRKSMVTGVFRRAGHPDKAAYFLSGLCCLNGRLPQGAPTSPALANLVCKPLDERLSQLSDDVGITYTRYADDLSFSCNRLIAEGFRRNIEESIIEAGFSIQRLKTRLMGPSIRREVTGLTVNQRVSIPRHRRRALRAYFHRIEQNASDFVHEKQRASGFASWLYDYHPVEGARAIAVAESIPDTT